MDPSVIVSVRRGDRANSSPQFDFRRGNDHASEPCRYARFIEDALSLRGLVLHAHSCWRAAIDQTSPCSAVRWRAILLPHWNTGRDQKDRTTALPFVSQDRFRYLLWMTNGDGDARGHHRDCGDREYSRPLPNEFETDFEKTHFPALRT